MRLIECHVEGFGKIIDKSYTFEPEISSFCFENGHGKTTLSAFIKAMLYGLDSVKSNSKNFEDRLHYLPFSGARFGGSLTVSCGSAEYRIERFFDKKSRVKDTLTVYKNRRETEELGDEVGERLLGLDKESFERTLFANAKDEFFGSTDGINAKLNNFSSGEENTATAFLLLEKAKRSIRAAKGSNDLLSRSEREKLELISQITNLEALSEELGSLYKKREHLSREIALLEQMQRADTNKRIRSSVIESYQRFSAEIDARRASCDDILAKHGNKLPSSEEIEKLRALSAEALAKEAAIGASSLNRASEERISELDIVFKDYLPEDDEVSAIEASAREFERVNEEIAFIEKSIESSSEMKFSLPTDEELTSKRELLSAYKSARAEIENLVSDSAPAKKRVKKPLLAVGILLAAASIPFIFIFLPVFFALITGAALLCFLSVGRQSEGNDTAVHLAHLRASSEELAEKLKLFLAKYGFFTEGGVVFDFSQLENACQKQSLLKKEKENRDSKLNEMLKKRKSLFEELSAFFSKLGYTGQISYREISEIRGLLRERTTLVAQKEEAAKALSSLKLEHSEICAKIRLILEGAGIAPDEFSQVSPDALANDRRSLDFEMVEIERLKRQQELFRRENGITDEELARREEKSDCTFSADELDLKRRGLASLDREISELEERVQALPEKQNALELAEEKITSLRRQLGIIIKTQEFLTAAEENMLEKFVGPVMNKFKETLSELSEATGERFSMDFGFNLKFEDAGEMRDEKHLSSGQRTIVDLALRLSLAEALFGTDGQFIILDDPFVSLDEIYMEKVKKYLKRAAKKHQIVYFCCHNSRNI